MPTKLASNTPKTSLTDDAFKVSLYLKATDGVLESLGGLLLFFLKPYRINSLVRLLTQHELSTDPHDFIANHLLRSAHNLTSASLIFGAIYLLSHGLLKIWLVIEVLRERLWAYVALIVVTAGFVLYQIYRLFHKPSIGLTILTVFDVVVIYLTQKEYRKRRLVVSDTIGIMNK